MCAALDLEEGETNPFERPFEEEEPSVKEPSVKELSVKEPSVKDPSENNTSSKSIEQIIAKTEVASQSEEEVDHSSDDPVESER